MSRDFLGICTEWGSESHRQRPVTPMFTGGFLHGVGKTCKNRQYLVLKDLEGYMLKFLYRETIVFFYRISQLLRLKY